MSLNSGWELLNEDCRIFGEDIEHLLRKTEELIAILVTIISKSRKL